MKNILKLIMVWSVLLVGGFANAQDLDVEIMERIARQPPHQEPTFGEIVI